MKRKVASGDSFAGGDGLSVGEVFQVQGPSEFAPPPLQDERQLVLVERTVFVGE